jgi:hypothetical protein
MCRGTTSFKVKSEMAKDRRQKKIQSALSFVRLFQNENYTKKLLKCQGSFNMFNRSNIGHLQNNSVVLDVKLAFKETFGVVR